MQQQDTAGIDVLGPRDGILGEVLSGDALAFVAALHRAFEGRRQELLARRAERQRAFDAGELPGFLAETRSVREGEWRVAPAPADLQDRRVEITGPVDAKMVINALNSGARVFMADFEDATSPTWRNAVEGQANLTAAIERTLVFDNPDGRRYTLNDELATLLVRPRGWHLDEKHLRVDGALVSGALFDFGLYVHRNARRLLERGSGPYLYLPKLESHLEARLWNDVFEHAQSALGLPSGTIRATVLIETVLAALEMEEILYELRDHVCGLNAGRWDYIFSFIKKLGRRPEFVLPDRAQVTMNVPFMNAYCELLVGTCHRRGAHAMGGMAAFVPSRRDAAVNEAALARVREDKEREAGMGFDGTWVAHPDLVPVARAEFDAVLGERPNQLDRPLPAIDVPAQRLLDVRIEGSTITEAGLRNNVNVAIQYLESWLRGVGAVAIFNLMEDAATAEIARSQTWQWILQASRLAEGPVVEAELVRRLAGEELERIRESVGAERAAAARYDEAHELFLRLALAEDFVEFLTLPAYARID
jgi:malate synthase